MDLGRDRIWMAEALKEGREALEEGEVPVGAVVVQDGRIIGRGHNRMENLNDATAHAEIIAIGAASGALGDWRLHDATLYVTLEPCMMCMGAIFCSRISRLVFGTQDRRGGVCGGSLDLGRLKYMDREVTIDGGVLEQECRELLSDFFARMRDEGKI
jgi:tRNA(adenine34) deaminase